LDRFANISFDPNFDPHKQQTNHQPAHDSGGVRLLSAHEI